MKKALGLIYIIICALSISIHAQSIGGQSNRSSAAQYYLGEDDELLVPVNIWGFVQQMQARTLNFGFTGSQLNSSKNV